MSTAAGKIFGKDTPARLKRGAVVVFLLSAMTFFLPRETFDPHLGVGVDVFCKSLYSIGDESQDADGLIDTRPLYARHIVYVFAVLPAYPVRSSDPTRAPPR
ncbi:MAG: hypothetical protein MUC76_11045 [Spirochaetes bacterium]|jgi:hypothetical protein|nr:hypothetical protein [Spirochaetota bacterium]